ncbi:hypothetical protein [Neptunicella marina]|uniref:Uncharacterized protein n=1 Tax=Neptunicella marina TaxID=2125989 RepID=A0A8J6ISN6_9ALTE|nr:hypothetical protein [Neptunicella marina]MBC3765694.1 hypothetical protein [Neptunicella marina]
MNASQLKAMRRFRKGSRFVGIWFVLIGGFMFYQFLGIYLNPEATILYNGVPTSDESIKLNALIFISLFVVLGVFFTLAPSKILNKLFVLKLSFKSAFGFRK